MANPILGIAGGLATTFLNNRMAQENASISYNRQKELMSIQNNMNMANAANMPGVQAFGLRKAGFNPAMVSGAGTQAAPTVSQGNADMPQTIPFSSQDALMLAQIRNIDAQTDKTNEEKRGVKQTNDAVDAANDAAVQGYLADWNREQEDLEKALKGLSPDSEEYNKIEGRIKELEKMKAKVSDPNYVGAIGIARGTEAARNETRDRARRLHEYLTGHLDNAVAEQKLGNGTVKALAGMDKATKDKLDADIAHVNQLIEESKSKEGLNDQQVSMLQKQIEQIGDAILRARLNDENYVRNQQSLWNHHLKVLNDAGYPKDSEAYQKVKEQADLWNSNFENLTETEFRKITYEIGKGVVTGVATGGAAGAAAKVAGQILNGKNKSVDLDKIPAYQPQSYTGKSKGNLRPDGSIGNVRKEHGPMPNSDPTQRADSYWKF